MSNRVVILDSDSDSDDDDIRIVTDSSSTPASRPSAARSRPLAPPDPALAPAPSSTAATSSRAPRVPLAAPSSLSSSAAAAISLISDDDDDNDDDGDDDIIASLPTPATYRPPLARGAAPRATTASSSSHQYHILSSPEPPDRSACISSSQPGATSSCRAASGASGRLRTRTASAADLDADDGNLSDLDMDPEFVAQAKRRRMQVAAIQRSQSSIFAAGVAAGTASASQPAPSTRGTGSLQSQENGTGKGCGVRRTKSAEEMTRARQEKEKMKAEEKARKEAEKERKRLEREEAKRQKELEKEQRKRFNNANKVQSKESYASELHAYFHLSLTMRIVDFDEIVRGLAGVGTKSTIVGPGSPIASLSHAPPPECVTFTRATHREFNPDRQVWEPTEHPIATRIPLILMVVDGFNLGDRVLADPHELPRELNKSSKRGRLYLIVENLDGWMKRKKTASNRARNAAGLGAAPSEQVPEWQRVLDTVNEWRLVHQFTVILTRNRNETVSYMNVIAREVGAMPYRKLAHLDETLCADISVASGKTNSDTWRLMLESIKGLTEPIARAIVSHYPTMDSLYKAYRRDPGRAPALLAAIQVVRDPAGNGKSRNIGPAMSGKIHSILMGTDPSFVL